MASASISRNFVCKCAFERNIFLKSVKKHINFHNEQQFLRDYTKELSQKGISGEKIKTLIVEIKDEILRRKSFVSKSIILRNDIAERYEHIHPHLLNFKEEYLSDEFLSLVNLSKAKGVTKDILIQQMKQEQAPLSCSFKVFKESFCDQLLEEVDNFMNSGLHWSKPNSMNNFGILLSELGYQDRLINPIVYDYLSPIVQLLYPEWVKDGLDSHHTFIVVYQVGKDVDLSYHYDDAEVTLNVSLGKNYEGGELFIGGMRDDSNWSSKCFKYTHKKAYGYLHRGQQMHGAIEIEDGERFNLIIWMRSSAVRNECCPMCNERPNLVEVEGDGAGFTRQQVDVCCTL